MLIRRKTLLNNPIYGILWEGTSSTACSRTDEAINLVSPNPYYAGNSSYSSPFDNIMPWKGMQRVTDSVAGELVSIPKFYYKWTSIDNKLQLQISMTKHNGFHTSPAHMDRGDGKGERDIVYIGRYPTNSLFKSLTGNTPSHNNHAGFRTGIHNLGSSYYAIDYAMWWTINMLYLVEFANWNALLVVGRGASNALLNSGITDSMPYHTGTTANSRTVYGGMTQYRYIELWWGNLRMMLDGINYSGANTYIILNPNNFVSLAGVGLLVGLSYTASTGYMITKWTIPEIEGYEWALIPTAVGGTLYGNDYTTGILYTTSAGINLSACGDYRNTYLIMGPFHCDKGWNSWSTGPSDGTVSSRIVKLP